MFAKTLALASLVLGSAACGPNTRNPNGGADANGSGSGSNQDGCSAQAKLIYVVDSNNTLSQFDPSTKQFTDLGTLNCPSQGAATPFSMGIDRNANAYVLYVEPDPLTGDTISSELFKVDTSTSALACAKTNWATQLNEQQFGMGFSTDTDGGTTDTLYIAGSANSVMSTSVTLASLNVSTMAANRVSTVTGSPELTGTGDAKLWGFFPSATATPKIEQLDKTTGAASNTHTLPALSGQPLAWAFAFYGGDFFVFLMKGTETSTTVYQVNGTTGAISGQTSANGRAIVGAGVSTCAPTIIM